MTTFTFKRLSFILFLGIIGLTGCESEAVEPEIEQEKEITSADVNFNVAFDPAFENTLYPSLILSLSDYQAKTGEDLGFIKYTLNNPKENTDITIKLKGTDLNSESILLKNLPNLDEEYSFSPEISWNYNNLKNLSSPGNISFSFECSIGDKVVGSKNLSLSYRSANECVYGLIDEEGNYQDLKWMFAAYVNEDHPGIDPILKEVLEYNIVDSFHGYQGSSEDVIMQVFSLWYHLQEKGVKYSSITNTSNNSQRVFTQHVRFFDEVNQYNQANCVDGSVFLSSILKKIEIKPFLVLVPGHMYLGFFMDSEKTTPTLLETTMVERVDLGEIYEDETYVYGLEKYRGGYLSEETYDAYINGIKTLAEVKVEISYNSFIEALDHNVESFNQNLSKFQSADDFGYQTIDIEAFRAVVQPIGR
jgi:hypothetical protein